ncbi:MAG TPA: ABC transporter substrate-binding protein [Firmicutes bacterium]|nr:ABC transporter substrate-binding protein [Bacillota bacterium]
MKKRVLFLSIVSLLLMVALQGDVSGNSNMIVIGEIAALTGPTAQQGMQERNGAVLAVEEINAAGGVLGKRIKLITYDFKGQPAEGVSAYRKLVQQDKACVIIGTNFSNVNLAIAPVAEQLKVPIVSNAMEPKVTTPEPGKVNKYHFLAQPSSIEQGIIVARFALKELGLKTAACIVDKGNSFATSQAESFRDYFNANGGKILEYVEYPAGLMDFKAQLTKIRAVNPDCLYIPQYAQQAGLQVKQARELGIKATILGANTLGVPPFVEAAGGKDVVAGVYFINNVNFKDPRLADFMARYEKRYGEPVITTNVFFGYDNIHIAVDAIRRAGSTDPEAIRDCLENTTNVKIMQGEGTISIDPKTHRPINMPAWIFKWESDGTASPQKLLYPSDR